LVAVAIIALFLATLAVLLAGIVSAIRQLSFVLRARRVQGRVTSEWHYRMYGRSLRHYRVEFNLSTGQRAELRSSVARSSSRPQVGQVVPVLIMERAGQGPKAKIDTWIELWFFAAVLLFIGAIGTLAVAFSGGSAFASSSKILPSNQSLNRTHNGMPPTGLISFWPCGVLPSRAG